MYCFAQFVRIYSYNCVNQCKLHIKITLFYHDTLAKMCFANPRQQLFFHGYGSYVCYYGFLILFGLLIVTAVIIVLCPLVCCVHVLVLYCKSNFPSGDNKNLN